MGIATQAPAWQVSKKKKSNRIHPHSNPRPRATIQSKSDARHSAHDARKASSRSRRIPHPINNAQYPTTNNTKSFKLQYHKNLLFIPITMILNYQKLKKVDPGFEAPLPPALPTHTPLPGSSASTTPQQASLQRLHPNYGSRNNRLDLSATEVNRTRGAFGRQKEPGSK